eukprot:COSAG05_NODE_88_length_20344_cov_12.094690_10_plen_693_part_00
MAGGQPALMAAATSLVLLLLAVPAGCAGSSGSTHLFTSALVASSNLTRATGAASKSRVAVLVPEHAWEVSMFFYHSFVTPTGGPDNVIWLFYMTFTNQSVYVCRAVSYDNGATFFKPPLGVVEFDGSTANNIVLQLSAYPSFVWPGAVFQDDLPGADPGARFKMTAERAGNTGMDIFGSPDGLHWRLLLPAVLPGSFADTQAVVFYDAGRGEYLAYGRSDTDQGRLCPGGPPSFRQVAWSTTIGANLSRWAPLETIFGFEDMPPCVDVYNSAAIQVHNAYFMMPSEYLHFKSNETHAARTNNDGINDIRLAVSSDGKNFEYTDDSTFIQRGVGELDPAAEGGDWHFTGTNFDSGIIFATRGYLETNTSIHLMYWGTQKTHGDYARVPAVFNTSLRYPEAKTGFGRVTLRRDGWFSHDTVGSAPGELTTTAVELPPSGLSWAVCVNAVTSVRGFLRLALLDNQTGLPIPGFELQNSMPLVGNHLRLPMRWLGAGSGAIGNRSEFRQHRAIKLEFAGKFMKLYSFEIGVACGSGGHRLKSDDALTAQLAQRGSKTDDVLGPHIPAMVGAVSTLRLDSKEWTFEFLGANNNSTMPGFTHRVYPTPRDGELWWHCVEPFGACGSGSALVRCTTLGGHTWPDFAKNQTDCYTDECAEDGGNCPFVKFAEIAWTFMEANPRPAAAAAAPQTTTRLASF